MSLLGALLIAVVVWTIGLIRSVRWQAFVYSLPIPITLVLATTSITVTSAQLFGVITLNVFFGVVTLAHHYLGWNILLADALAIGAYVGLSWSFGLLPELGFWWVLAGVTALWVLAQLLLATTAADPERERPGREQLHWAAKFGLVLAGSLLMSLLGGLLNGFVVTFPYSGVLAAIEVRRDIREFARHFARNSVCLLGFFAAFYAVQDTSRLAAFAAGWAGFGLCAGLLHAGERVLTARTPSPGADRP
ncbi:hypothetical protein [Longispora albida]|uniref:hypothetical protein n=1 Tax=Longispora albida TaxID=203523 RepID=UPI000370997C|nr:hypothetical protein [Longispora albida]